MNQNNNISDENLSIELQKCLEELKASCREIATSSTDIKNKALLAIANELEKESTHIFEANKEDLKLLPVDTNAAFRDRLLLNEKRLSQMIESLKQVAKLPDPVGEEFSSKVLNNGLQIRQIRAPLGLIFMIFESRPNVITEAFSLAFKSGNAILLRGGSESKNIAHIIYKIISSTLKAYGFYQVPFAGVENYDRKIVEVLLRLKKYIDVVVPRGGDKLIEFVQKTSLMPIIKNDRGLCHTYVADDANIQMAVKIVKNAKTQRPGVCNALETVLVHQNIADKFLPLLYKATLENNLKWHVDSESLKIMQKYISDLDNSRVILAKQEDWDTEYLDYIMNCKVVNNIDEALVHISRHGSKHSEAIVTESALQAKKFQSLVDAAAVYWNASTRFTDGYEFGLGGELGISTQKLHVRGPVGLRELTTPRWIISGTGQIRE